MPTSALTREGLWEQPGEPILDLIQSLAEIDEDPAQAVLDHLAETHNAVGKDALVDPQPYDVDSQYEERGIDSYEFDESWATFKSEVGSRSRFFNRSAMSMLEHIFEGIAAYESNDSASIIREYGPKQEEAIFYRSRIAKSYEQVRELLTKLPASIAPPASHLARAGRMNAAGISVFYGALEAETCVAEVRAPVGSWVVTSAFIPVRPLRLLDLGRLRNVFVQGSIFDDSHIEALTRLHFLKHLVGELSAPVMPGDEESKYLPTQVVAEYLGMEPSLKLDGIIFPSSQVSGVGNNVVLFNHASVIEGEELPDEAQITVSFGYGDPEELDESEIVIFETVPEPAAKSEGETSNFPFLSLFGDPPKLGELPELPSSLKVDVDKTVVSRIQGVSYDTNDSEVRRIRSKLQTSKSRKF